MVLYIYIYNIYTHIHTYRGADNSLARPTSRCIFLVRAFRLMLVLLYIYIYIYIHTYTYTYILYIALIFLQL